MYHSINFLIGDKTYNTWETWRLIPSPRPSVALPKVRTKFLDIPGMNGKMDISDILTGKPLYDDRTGSWDFYVSRRPFEDGTRHDWTVTWQKLADALHGKKGEVWLEDDPFRAYSGRFAIGEKFDSQKNYSKITIQYTLAPFSGPASSVPHTDPATGEWLWGPFNFFEDEIDPSTNPHTLVNKEHM